MKRNLYVLTCALCTLLSLPLAAQVPAYVPTDGLVGWWPFNGNANDESGNGNNGVVNGATLTEDRFGNANNAYSFGGTNHIDCGESNALAMSNNLTYSCWGRTTFQFSNLCIGGRWTNVTSIEPFGTPEYCLAFNNSGVFSAIVISTPPNEYAFAPFNYYDGNWHLYTMTYDGATNKIYVDGQLQGSLDVQGSIPIYPNKFVIGTYGLATGPTLPNTWQGEVDDVALWNRALTEQEIQNIYTGQCPTVATNCTTLPSNLQQGLVGYWPFCGNANDESGNGNDGTVNGATLTEDRFEYASKAYQFNGDTDDISVEVSSPVDINRSISFWAKVDSGTMNVNPSRNIIALGNDFNVTFGDWGDNGKSAISVHSGIQWVADTTIIDDGNWHFYSVIITSGNSDSLAFYQDGELLNGRINFGGFNCAVSNSVIKIGSGYAEGDNLNGTLDDIGIWNRALTPEEVQELYTLNACTFTVYDTTYVTVYDTVTTYVTVTDTLLIDITFTGFEGQPSWLNTVTVFPNPASDHITIDYGNFALMAGYNTIITDTAGATVYSSAVNSQQVEIDINAWGAMGVYYMSIYDANGALVAVRHIVLE